MVEQQEEYYPMQQPINFSHSSEGSLKFQINVDEILNDLKQTLLAQEVIVVKGEYKYHTPEGVRPLINSKGVNSVLTILKSRLTKIFILSDLEEKTIEEITLSIGQNVIDDLLYNWGEYEIRDDASATLILNTITDTIFATLRKGYKGNYLKFLRTTTSIQETQHQNIQSRPQQAQDEGNKGIMDAMFGRKRR